MILFKKPEIFGRDGLYTWWRFTAPSKASHFLWYRISWYVYYKLTLVLPKEGWLPPPSWFFPVAPNQKESDLSHVSDLSNILCSYFDEKGVSPYPGIG